MRTRDSRLAKIMRPREKTCVPTRVILRFRELCWMCQNQGWMCLNQGWIFLNHSLIFLNHIWIFLNYIWMFLNHCLFHLNHKVACLNRCLNVLNLCLNVPKAAKIQKRLYIKGFRPIQTCFSKYSEGDSDSFRHEIFMRDICSQKLLSVSLSEYSVIKREF